MDLELPNRLHATRDLLMRSLAPHPLERAPAMPASLASDLVARFAPSPVTIAAPPSASWMERALAFLATPGFGAAAAAVVVIGIAIPMFSTPDASGPEFFRGGETSALPVDAVRIVFVGENPAILAAVKSSGDFEASAIGAETSDSEAGTIAGPKVVIDFAAGSIIATDRDGSVVYEIPIPPDVSAVPVAIATAVSRL